MSSCTQLWVQIARGEVSIGDERLAAGDGVAISAAGNLTVAALGDAEILLFDMGDRRS
jgi:quercetin 2,3-dioxygenase